MTFSAAVFLGAVLVAGSFAGCGGTKPQGSIAPTSTRAEDLLAMADSAMISGAYPEALEGYRRAGRTAESRGDRALLTRAAVGVGLAALLEGDANDARASLTRAVELDPASAAAHVGLGRYFTAVRRYRDARAEFERAQVLEPGSAEPAYRLGMAYVQAGERAEAIRAFTRALERDPAHGPCREALKPLLEERYRAAGVPSEYASIIERSSVSRGELGVMLAVELGLNPDRPGWRSDAPPRPVPRDVEGAWGMTWLRAAVERGLIEPYPDGAFTWPTP